jgi:hypothetical protein
MLYFYHIHLYTLLVQFTKIGKLQKRIIKYKEEKITLLLKKKKIINTYFNLITNPFDY